MRTREELYQRIEKRVDHMVTAGLLQEVQALLDRGYDAQLKALQSIGYKQMVNFRQGRISWEEAVAQMKRNTKRFAKRQVTWFRRDPEIAWIVLPDELDTMAAKVKNFLKLALN
jgi:tRNA dimethylallyltransferase